MRDLGQIQYSELANDIRRGWVDIADVIVVNTTVCVKDGDRLSVRIHCASERGAQSVLAILQGEEDCPSC